MKLNFEQIKQILPQRFPILMIDRVLECVPGERLTALKVISGSDPVLQGHYPDFAIFPGVYLIETMAQAMSILAFKSQDILDAIQTSNSVPLLTSVDKVRFRAPVIPGSVLRIEVKIKARKLRTIYFTGEIYCEDKKVCEGVLSCSVVALNTLNGL